MAPQADCIQQSIMVHKGFTRCRESQLRRAFPIIGVYYYHRRCCLIHKLFFFPKPCLSLCLVPSLTHKMGSITPPIFQYSFLFSSPVLIPRQMVSHTKVGLDHTPLRQSNFLGKLGGSRGVRSLHFCHVLVQVSWVEPYTGHILIVSEAEWGVNGENGLAE